MPTLDPDLRALQEVRDCVARAKAATKSAYAFSQGQVDALCKAMAEAGEAAAYDLARAAVEETGIGRVHYKVLKNVFGSRGVWESIRDEKTVGIVTRDERRGVIEVATPVGIVAGIVPTTNPTSTALGKALISVKGRNAIVISPHPRSRRCIGEAVEVLRRAIERAGGPPDLVQSLSNPTIESTGALMKHKDVSIILATGGSGLVKAAYSSGKPAYGVGPGNVPLYVDRSADIPRAARSVVSSQSFDNATLCCSEQGLVLDRPIADRMLEELKKRGAHLCTSEQTDLLARHCNVGGHMNPDVVGLDPWRVAEAAGFSVPRETTVLLAHQDGVGPEHPLSIEILCPLLSVHIVDGWKEGCRVSMETLHSDGLGHTCGVHARDDAVLEAWFLEKPANRILVNGPCSQGAVGYSTMLVPSMSLGCGPQAGNITSDNITARHLLNIKRVAFVRSDWEAREVEDHAAAARSTHDPAPRGSCLPGDPGAGSGSGSSAAAAPAADAHSNWQGNPGFQAQGSAPTFTRPAAPAGGTSPKVPPAPGPRAKVVSAPKAQAAPPSTTPAKPRAMSATPGPATAVVARPAASAAAPKFTAPQRQRSDVGAGLSTDEIREIMSHAGAGCPLGPCKGCPHNNVETGECTA